MPQMRPREPVVRARLPPGRREDRRGPEGGGGGVRGRGGAGAFRGPRSRAAWGPRTALRRDSAPVLPRGRRDEPEDARRDRGGARRDPQQGAHLPTLGDEEGDQEGEGTLPPLCRPARPGENDDRGSNRAGPP